MNPQNLFGFPDFRGPFFLLLIWSLIWKGMALWRAAKKDQKYWYIALLILNTAGILEIVYLLTFGKEEVKKTKSKKSK